MTARLTAHFIVHGSYDHILPALSSLYDTTQTPVRVEITINTGDSPQIDTIRAQFPQAEIIINPTPQGFAANHNAAMRRAQTEFIALLNDDIRLDPGALDRLVDYLQTHPDIGLAGPALRYPDGSPQVSAYSDPHWLRSIYKISGLATLTNQRSPLRRWLLQLGIGRLVKVESLQTERITRIVPVIKGVAMVTRREVYERVGGMDEVTQAYGEEYGWHWRIRQAGWKLAVIEEAQVTHYGLGQAELQLSGWLMGEDRKSLIAYYAKYRARWQAALIRAAIVFFHSLYALGWLLFDRQRARAHWRTVQIGIKKL